MKYVGKMRLEVTSDREIAMSRDFNAPRQRVFDAFTKPELVKRWLSGPPGWTMVVCEIDLRVGGMYRYVWHNDAGPKMGMRGVYREVVAPERIVATEKFDEAWYPGEAVGTLTLTEHAGITTVTQKVLYQSKEALEAVLKTPMEQGVAGGYDKLEVLLATM